jgi:hypothetical protein
MAQLVVVDQVFVAQRNPKHTLPNKGWHRVFDQFPRTAVRKTRGEPIDQSDRAIRRYSLSLVIPRSPTEAARLM